jgi:hypothetical protein
MACVVGSLLIITAFGDVTRIVEGEGEGMGLTLFMKAYS